MQLPQIPDGATCPICGGRLENGTMTFTMSVGRMVMVVHDTPAAVCSQCGEECFTAEASRRFEAILKDMKTRGTMLEVVNFNLEEELVEA